MADTPPFGNDATDERFRSIGEAAAETGVKPHILRYWEDSFPQLRPLKRAGGRRYYRHTDLDLIRHIDDLVNRRGYTFAGARSVLAGEDGAAPMADNAQMGAQPSGLTARQRQGLLALRADLAEMLAQLRAA